MRAARDACEHGLYRRSTIRCRDRRTYERAVRLALGDGLRVWQETNVNGVLRVVAESAYPTVTAGARVCAAAFAPFLRMHDVDLQFVSHVSDDEYRVLGTADAHLDKARILALCAGRVARRSRPSDALLLVHRLLSLVPVPGRDPPARVDVYDFDDALFVGSNSAVNRSFRALKREAERCRAHMRRARLVLAGNEYLAAHARRYAKHVEVVPSCVDASAWTPRIHSDVEILTVGWMGSASTTPYLLELLPVFSAINARGVRMRLLAVGAAELPAEAWIEQQPWTLHSEAQMLSRFDIGVMPLPDDPWTRGKCGYKLLQYFAAGVPAVASPVGVNGTLIGDDRGLLADSAAGWRRAFEQLAADTGERRERGAAARKFVERHYSYQRWASELAGLLQSVPR